MELGKGSQEEERHLKPRKEAVVLIEHEDALVAFCVPHQHEHFALYRHNLLSVEPLLSRRNHDPPPLDRVFEARSLVGRELGQLVRIEMPLQTDPNAALFALRSRLQSLAYELHARPIAEKEPPIAFADPGGRMHQLAGDEGAEYQQTQIAE